MFEINAPYELLEAFWISKLNLKEISTESSLDYLAGNLLEFTHWTLLNFLCLFPFFLWGLLLLYPFQELKFELVLLFGLIELWVGDEVLQKSLNFIQRVIITQRPYEGSEDFLLWLELSWDLNSLIIAPNVFAHQKSFLQIMLLSFSDFSELLELVFEVFGVFDFLKVHVDQHFVFVSVLYSLRDVASVVMFPEDFF